MAYTRHTWVDGEVITEDKLNNIEEGIGEAMQKGDGAIIAQQNAAAAQKAIDDHIADYNNPHKVTKAQLGLDKVENVAVNDMAPTYTDITELSTLTSGEKIGAAFAKVKLAITKLMEHLLNTNNPHNVTLTQLGITKTAAQLNAKELPDVTTADNDKFLRVVDGEWAAVSLPIGEEMTF